MGQDRWKAAGGVETAQHRRGSGYPVPHGHRHPRFGLGLPVIRFESIIHEFDPWYGDGGVRWEGRAGINTANRVAVLVESSMVQVTIVPHTIWR